MRLHVPVPLRWGDLDAYGHVNNVEVLRLLEEARVRTFWRGSSTDPDPLPTAILELDPESATWSLVARSEIEYLAPMPYTRAPIDVEVWIGRIGGASLDICFELFSPIGVEPRVRYARAMTSIVTVDSTSGRPTRVDRELRTVWSRYVEAPPEFTRR